MCREVARVRVGGSVDVLKTCVDVISRIYVLLHYLSLASVGPFGLERAYTVGRGDSEGR